MPDRTETTPELESANYLLIAGVLTPGDALAPEVRIQKMDSDWLAIELAKEA